MFPKFLQPIEVHSIHELALGAIVALFFWPMFFIIYCVNVSLRFLAQQLSNFSHPGRYVITSGEDSVFGVKLPGSSKSYIYGYQILRGEPNIDLIRSKLENVVVRSEGYEKLGYVMTHKNGYFFWDTQVPFDVTRNIRLLDNFDPDEIVDEEKLTDICSKMVGTEVGNEDMPQWEILMIPKYKVAGQPEDSRNTSHYALILRFHHAYCDGISFVLLINKLIADVPGELPIDPRKGFDNPLWIKVYIWAKLLIIGPFNFFKNLGLLVFTKSEFRVEHYVQPKILVRSSAVEMDTLRKIRLASGTSVTAITISAVFGALYKAHLRMFPGKPIPEKFHFGSIGVMLPYSEEKRLVNQFTMWRFTGPLKAKGPKERLEHTFEEIRKSASQPDPVFNFFMQRALGSLPKFLHEILFNLSGTPSMLSNVPGFSTHVKAFGGEIVDVAAWIPLVTTTGIGLSSQSYCGKMNFSAITDPQLFPTPNAARVFLEEIVNEINILTKIYVAQDTNKTGANNTAVVLQTGEGQTIATTTAQYAPQLLRNKSESEDVNHNRTSAVLTPQHTPPLVSPNSIILADHQKDQNCRHRRDESRKVGENENPVKGTSCSLEKKVEKVI